MLIVSNWKAYVENAKDAHALLAIAKRAAGKSRKLHLILLPPAPLMGVLAARARGGVLLGSQDVSAKTVGAATGEVHASLVRALGGSYALVGHSERRALGETDALVAEKAKQALGAGLIPILCVGERERDADARYLRFLGEQIRAVYGGLSPREREKVVLAYEPVWAIGKRAEDAIDPRDLAEMVLYMRKVLGEFLPGKGAQKAVVLYGGSAEPENVRGLMDGTGIQGFLVGHASAEPALFSALLKAVNS